MALWDHVQSKGVDSGSGTSANLAFDSNVTAGNFITVSARIAGTSQNPGCTDTLGNTYTREILQENGVDTLVVFKAVGISGGACTVTLTNASAGTRRWAIAEYANDGSTISVDQKTSGTGTGTTADSGNVTTTSASELLFGAAMVSSAQTFTAGTSYTKRIEVSQKMAIEDRAVGSTGTYSASFTFGGSDDWMCAIVTFKATAAGGGGGFRSRIAGGLVLTGR